LIGSPYLMSGLSVRPWKDSLDAEHVVDYYLSKTDEEYLTMGIDKTKLLSKENWIKLLVTELQKNDKKNEKMFIVIWELDNKSIGHSMINDLEYGKFGFCHLHMWKATQRKKGMGEYFMIESLKIFFKEFEFQEIFCTPNSMNPAPNKCLLKIGFKFIETQVKTPGYIQFEQEVNLYSIDQKTLYKS
jgi:[ribosomal protein S5]-alanine N-acetyltransferase